MRRLAIVLSLLLLTAALPAAADAKVRKGPGGLAFYKPPKPLPAGKHGALIWARRLTGRGRAQGRRRQPAAALPLDERDGQAGRGVGHADGPEGQGAEGRLAGDLVGARHDRHRRPVRALARRAGRCSSDYAYPLLQRWLKAGYAVVRTDYEGLGTPGAHPYLIGRSEGHSVLDAVRAARRLDTRLGKRVVISGHSQGGQPALWAASLAPKYDARPQGARHGRVRAGLAPRRAVARDLRAARRRAALSGLWR